MSDRNPLSIESPAISILPISIFLLMGLFSLGASVAQDEDPPEYSPGLIGKYRDDQDRTFSRIDSNLLFQWNGDRPDVRLTAGSGFDVQWTGLLFVNSPGKHRLGVHSSGKVQVQLLGRTVIDGEFSQPTWQFSEEVDLPFGRHPITVLYRTDHPQGRLGLYWSGPQFQLEPISEKHLVHRSEDEDVVDGRFEEGEWLDRGLRCVACHLGAPDEKPLPGPALTHLRGNIHADWIVEMLQTGGEEPLESEASVFSSHGRRMPHFQLTTEEARAIVAALFHHSEKTVDPIEVKSERPDDFDEVVPSKKSKKKEAERTEPNAESGKRLLETRGCLACHSENTSVAADNPLRLFDGGDLSQISKKRPPSFFPRWLRDPGQVNPDHRMPQVDLSELERKDLALYLSRGGRDQESDPPSDLSQVQLGESLLERHRCGACHQLPGERRVGLTERNSLVNPVGQANPRLSSANCLDGPNPKEAIPGYRLNARQKEALIRYRSERLIDSPLSRDGRTLLVEKNCLACHARGVEPGITPRLQELVDGRGSPSTLVRTELRNLLPALTPPSLNGVGDKLMDGALRAAILRNNPSRRPWTEIRMPKYKLRDEELSQLIGHLIQHDRIPDTGRYPLEFPADSPERFNAARLVTSDGFGCNSCHKIGNSEAAQVPINARGTDLTMLGKEIRREWFDRWVRDPVRIVPRIEMPAIQQPIKGLLGDDLPLQLAAVWKSLNTPGFNPPQPNPVRIVRAHNNPKEVEPARVVTDVVESRDRNYLRPLLIGLTNRHNLLFDLERGEIGRWWIGDTARQRTRGKSWYWEAGNESLVGSAVTSQSKEAASQIGESFSDKHPPFIERMAVKDGLGRLWTPQPEHQFAWMFDQLHHEGAGVVWKGRLRFVHENKARELAITSKIFPYSEKQDQGIEVSTEVMGLGQEESLILETGDSLSMTVLDPKRDATNRAIAVIDQATTITWQGESLRWEPYGAKGIRLVQQSPTEVPGNRGSLKVSTPMSWSRRLISRHAVDQIPEPAKTTYRPQPVFLSVVPGFEAVQLPLLNQEMPTGFTWQPDGTLVISSLKGRVLRVVDEDHDGDEDRYVPISDDLPAPYGVAAVGEEIDVIAKYGLLRLSPQKEGDLPYAVRVLADDWGYTADYHDWAVGLPKDERGNYYLALPCQQDDRTAAAARRRGEVLQLVPKPLDGKHDEERSFDIYPHSAGHRFPMGIARNRQGELFTSDNQGNYNPFNELNHLVVGARYGFINKREAVAGFSPPFQSPAIEIPHPWVRSVNGICFLETPQVLLDKGLEPIFGPHEGHLIGCEYNGRSLVRMSLQRVGDSYQGAVYPFSRPPLENQPTFEGPVACSISPRGEVFVGSLHDSGWGGGNNTGSIVRLRRRGDLPLGIAEVQANFEEPRRGLRIVFSGPIEVEKLKEASAYSLRSFRRISTPAYGGADQDERWERIRVEVEDARTVDLLLDELREGYVYELRVTFDGQPELFPQEAYYTMKRIRP